jgi:hypothetical protein
VTAAARLARWLARHAGRRGAFLAFLAVLDLAYGRALITSSVIPLAHGPDFLLPLAAWGWIWTGTGAACAAGVLMARDRIPYTLAAALKGAWGVLYASIWVEGTAPDAWVSVAVWLTFSLTVLLVAGWPEPPHGAPR